MIVKVAECFDLMTPKAFATIICRILGVWLVLEAIFGLVSVCLLYREVVARGSPTLL